MTADGSRGRTWSRSRTMRCRASITRTMCARWSRSGAGRARPPTSANSGSSSTISGRTARTAASPSISSTIPASGCSTCRCSTRAMSNGRRRAWRCRAKGRARNLPRPGTSYLATLSAEGRADEQAALTSARLFTDYLRACRDERFAMSLLPPGRFLMPGNLADSPALTFAPLDVPADGSAPEGSLWAMMVRRYEAYKDVVVRPFFRDHFARLDRQIVLVDALAAFNAGPEALHDLEAALAGILDCFRIGRDDLLLQPVPAAHRPHPVRRDQGRPSASFEPRPAGGDPAPRRGARRRARRSIERRDRRGGARRGARHARGARSQRGRDKLPSILGTPAAGESANGEIVRRRDGGRDLSGRPARRSRSAVSRATASAAFPARRRTRRTTASCASARRSSSATATRSPALPHIRLDRALQFLIGDRLQ